MILTAQELFSAYTTMAGVLAAPRALPVPAACRMLGLMAALKADFDAINDRRNTIISDYGEATGGEGEFQVPADKVADFGARMADIQPIEREVEPIKATDLQIAVGGSVQMALSLNELVRLGPLVEA